MKGTAEIFYRKATSWKGSQAPPIFVSLTTTSIDPSKRRIRTQNVEGIHFIHICRNGLYFVCTTKFNVSATFVLELLGRYWKFFENSKFLILIFLDFLAYSKTIAAFSTKNRFV